MGRCSRSYAQRLLDNYITNVNSQIYQIQKNFGEMDFENAKAKEEMAEIIDKMINCCNSLISDLETYNF